MHSEDAQAEQFTEAGDLLTATFLTANSVALHGTLKKRSDFHYDELEGVWVWDRDGTLLARLELIDDRLMLEVNSRGRLERAREWLDRIPGLSFERATARSRDRSDQALDDRLPSPAEPSSAETLEFLREHIHGLCLRWLDERIPALGDLTPRQACATKRGRKQVKKLLRTMPPIMTPDGPIEPPRQELLGELGLDAGD